MRNIVAVFKKQLKDTLKNKTVLIQFLMFPIITVVMNHAVNMEGMPENFFVTLFATMFIGMAPLTSVSAIVSEEKEKNTLRVLLMSNVKPGEFLCGVGSYVWIICMLGSVVFCVEGGYKGAEAAIFMGIMAVGMLCSLLIGAAIGIWSKNQMMATSVAIPVMMVFAFLPMLAMFNEAIGKVAKYTYSDQINRMLNQIHQFELSGVTVLIVGINMALAVVAFVAAYKKCGLA